MTEKIALHHVVWSRRPDAGVKFLGPRSKEQAQQTALAKAPGGTVKEGELEKENGKLIWSFAITTPDSKDITEVNVDAITGDVVSVDKENINIPGFLQLIYWRFPRRSKFD